ncbi:MAG: hypothetical protein M3Y91_06910 [Actinomycetota bacterium]|nr:hypothetical protein [Actinomycetota bacterium]
MSNFGGADYGAKLAEVIGGQRLPTRPFTGPQHARVLTAGPTTLTFALVGVPGFEQVRFGPAPYPRPALLADAGGINLPAVPPIGTACIVDFVGFNLDSPFVTLFVAWPTP